MLRDTSILYELSKQLKEHNYINRNSDELLTTSQQERLNDYIDDLSIDLFFRLASFKPIILKNSDGLRRFTPFGFEDVIGESVLNLNSRYDRYTFLHLLIHTNFLKNKFKNNSFIMNLSYGIKHFSATGVSPLLTIGGIYDNSYLDAYKSEYKNVDVSNNRSAMLYGLGNFTFNAPGVLGDIRGHFANLTSDYLRIKDYEVFPGVTLEYALSIYVILVEKVKLKDNNISTILALGLYNSGFDITHPLQLFHNFELKLDRLFRKTEIDVKDVYLRFVKAETSKAFNIAYNKPHQNFVNIQLFRESPISDVFMYNTLPLPYLQNNLTK